MNNKEKIKKAVKTVKEQQDREDGMEETTYKISLFNIVEIRYNKWTKRYNKT